MVGHLLLGVGQRGGGKEDVSKEERLMEALLVYFREFKRSGGWSRSPENLIAHVQSKGWSLNFLLCTTL